MVDNPTIKKPSEHPIGKPLDIDLVAPTPPIEEEKVEVLIKESVLINPRDFSAFKHATEEFFNDWGNKVKDKHLT